MLDKIDVHVDKMPYRVGIYLGSTMYDLEFHKNSTSNRICISLYQGDVCLCAGEPMVLNRQLFENSFLARVYPPLRLVVQNNSHTETEASKDNIGKTVFLCVDDS